MTVATEIDAILALLETLDTTMATKSESSSLVLRRIMVDLARLKQ
jgi:hypothetical protein